ncbi:MAG: TonB-dependent receptor [Gemmatimonadota bacterium]|nr:TonB-dependent receptor [Gemmatimonadota bacterium]
MRVFSYLLGAFALLVTATGVGAQFPGELRGDVIDVLSGRPVPSADVRLEGSPSLTTTDAAGAFRLRGIEPGSYTLSVRAPGYAAVTRTVVIENGAVTSVRVELLLEAVEVEGVVARVDATPEGARSLRAADLDALAGGSVGDLVDGLPGVRVESRGRGGAEVPSIRGSGGDAVLVLVDGVPINDPITGEADLSTVPSGSVSAIHVLPGGRSARYGARAEGGVVLVETGGREEGERSAGVTVGSLGERSFDATYEQGVPLGDIRVAAGARRLDGRFDFDVPEEAGGGEATRENAHADGEHARVEWVGEREDTRFRLGVAGERLARGLPGRSFAPSRTGGQELRRMRAFGSLDVEASGRRALSTNGYFVTQRMEHRDSAPPFGDPFDDRTTLRSAGGEIEGSWRPGSVGRVAVGLSLTHLRVESTQLAEGRGTVRRTDAGAWLSGSRTMPLGATLSATARLDRSGLPSRWYVSHDVGLAWSGGSFGARLGHRSSFSPPTLGDQFFREGVGVEPNPDLEAERVPSEWVAGASYEHELSGTMAMLELEAYQGDIEGMIIWLPDYRFVWSPRNRDVRRRGAEVSARLRRPSAGLDLRGHVSWNRTTYDRPGLDDTQVVYRPEWGGGTVATWSSDRWRAAITTDYVGARYPVPNRVNRLPAFWTTDLALARSWATPLGDLEVGVELDRVFDHEDSLIFAFPDPGRTARLTVRLGR